MGYARSGLTRVRAGDARRCKRLVPASETADSVGEAILRLDQMGVRQLDPHSTDAAFTAEPKQDERPVIAEHVGVLDLHREIAFPRPHVPLVEHASDPRVAP